MTRSASRAETIGRDDFAKVELRVGRIVEARMFAEARKPACVLQVDFGAALGIRKSSAQIAGLYRPEELSAGWSSRSRTSPKRRSGR